jgi:hypothetical protein
MNIKHHIRKKKFDDTKEAIISRNSKNDRQHNDHKKTKTKEETIIHNTVYIEN